MKWTKSEKKVSDLVKYDARFKVIDQNSYERLKKSIIEIGIIEPLIINTNNVIIDGNSRLDCLLELKVEKVICMIPERELTEKEHARAYIRKNKNIAGIDDYDVLRQNFTQEEIDEYGIDIEIPDNFVEEEKVITKKYPYEIFCNSEEEKKEIKDLISAVETFLGKKINKILAKV